MPQRVGEAPGDLAAAPQHPRTSPRSILYSVSHPSGSHTHAPTSTQALGLPPALLGSRRLWTCLPPCWILTGLGPASYPAGSPTILSPLWLSLLTYCTNHFGEGELADPPHSFPTVGWEQAQGLQGLSQVGVGPSILVGQDGGKRKAEDAVASLCHS